MSKLRDPLIIFVIVIVAAIAAVLFFLPTRQGDGGVKVKDSRPVVAATILPLADIVRQVAGDAVRVALILPAGASPHTFDPSPSVLQNIVGSEVIYAIGHGLDDWALSLRDAVHSGYVVVDKGIALRATSEIVHDEDEEEEHEEDEHDGPIDPHYWLDARNAALIAQTVRDDLSIRFPDHAATFRVNGERYVAELAALDAELRAALADIENPRIITLHDAWYYFAAAYGLEIVGTFEPSAGREPTPMYLIRLSDAVKEAGTKVLFSEPQLSTASISAFVEDNGLEIRTLDPEGTPERPTYIEMMRYNADTVLGR